MKALFIGGTGRLSKDVACLAADSGIEVSVLTRGSKIRSKFADDRYEMIRADIRQPNYAREVLAGRRFDVVIDFLSYTPEQMELTLGAIEGLFEQYVFISSATVYDKRDRDEIISEESTPVGNQRWSYAYQKYLCEKQLARRFARQDDSCFTVIRPYVTYGNTRVPYPIVPQNSLFEWTLVDRVKRGLPIPVFDDGKTATTLTHTRDFAKGVVGLFGNGLAANEAFHITDDSPVCWSDVLDCLEAATGNHVVRCNMSQEEIYVSMREYRDVLLGDKGVPMRFDTSKIHKAVPDFECSIALQDGIAEMVAFYEADPAARRIDYLWDGRVDRLCAGYRAVDRSAYEFSGGKDGLRYSVGRNKALFDMYRVERKLKSLLGGKR